MHRARGLASSRALSPAPAMEDAEELLGKIRALEEGQAELRREVTRLTRTTERRHAGAPWLQPTRPPFRTAAPRMLGRARLSRRHHAMILQSMGESVHVIDLQGKILSWNRQAEHLYGYSALEAIGRNIIDLLIDPRDTLAFGAITKDIFTGKCWRGKFPVRNKSGERLSIFADATPLYDDNGALMGLICLTADLRILREIVSSSPFVGHWNFMEERTSS
ncbi:hypothetical protein ACP70R_000409 [Stipagrostis hirtigluma subsp. patula]